MDADGRGAVWRALRYLKPYRMVTAGAYLMVILTSGLAVYMPLVIRGIIDEGIRSGSPRAITTGSIVLLSCALIKGLFTFLSGRWSEIASQNVAYDIRNLLHLKVLTLPFSFHDRTERGVLLTRVISDVDRVRFLTGRALLRIAEIITLVIGSAVAMFKVNLNLSLLTLVFLPFLAVVAFIFGRKIRPASQAIRRQEEVMTSRLDQNFRGARIIKAYAAEKRETALFGEDNRELYDRTVKEAFYRNIFVPLMNFIAGCTSVVILLYGGYLVINGGMTLGTLVAFSTYAAQFIGPIRRFGMIVTAIAQASVSSLRIFEILDTEPEIMDGPGAGELDNIAGEVVFDNVSFSYPDGTRVLDNIAFTIKPGMVVALLGATGSGKSSIINLIPRFYDPSTGSVRIDGRDIRDISLRSLRGHIGIVLQDSILFAASVKDNIAFGDPDASLDKVVAASRVAHAHEFIESMSGGYDTMVGEQGATLSGGQKQRIAIARALLKDPKILILDDAMSSVDTDTEHLIQEALENLMHDRTTFIIAQRLSTVRKADLVIVLDRGKIHTMAGRTDGQNPHDILYRRSPFYREIYERQLMKTEGEG